MAEVLKLNDSEIQAQLQLLTGWELKNGEITKLYKLKDFLQAIDFVNRTAGLAETAEHHPNILIRYNKVTLTLSTHSAGGLTQKDFALAKEIDAP